MESMSIDDDSVSQFNGLFPWNAAVLLGPDPFEPNLSGVWHLYSVLLSEFNLIEVQALDLQTPAIGLL